MYNCARGTAVAIDCVRLLSEIGIFVDILQGVHILVPRLCGRALG